MRMLKQLILRIKIRLRGKQFSEPYIFLLNVLGFTPKDFAPYMLALRHRSVNGESNERLEFLGDAVISSVVSDFLYRNFPKSTEGQLSTFRAKLVCRKRLNSVAQRVGLDRYLKKGAPLRKNASNAFGNALEAFVGAIYISDGYNKAYSFISHYMLGKSALSLCVSQKENDFKSKVLEWGQHMHRVVSFNQLSESYDSLSDSHTFIFEVCVDDVQVAQGAGKTKKEAQQQAAKMALRWIANS